jgi:hypothetical protein
MHLWKHAVVPHPIRQSQRASDVGSLETATHAGSQAARKHASQAGDSDSMVHSPPAMPAAPALPALPALPPGPMPALPALPALPAAPPAAPAEPLAPAAAPPVPAVPACPAEPDVPPLPAEPPGSAGSEPVQATRHNPTQPSTRRNVFMGSRSGAHRMPGANRLETAMLRVTVCEHASLRWEPGVPARESALAEQHPVQGNGKLDSRSTSRAPCCSGRQSLHEWVIATGPLYTSAGGATRHRRVERWARQAAPSHATHGTA